MVIYVYVRHNETCSTVGQKVCVCVYLFVKRLVCRLPGPQKLLTVKNSVLVVKEVLDSSASVTEKERDADKLEAT